jgi:hypothetical protein
MFGLALAAVDRTQFDRELFYCAALLHDYGIATPTPHRDFTLGSAERAIVCAAAAGVAAGSVETLADAICVHTTPGVSIKRDGPLGCYLQWGAMADVAGLRLWDITHANVEAVLRRHPRGVGFKGSLAAMIGAEASAIPRGRFALLVRCGVLFAVRLAPFEE